MKNVMRDFNNNFNGEVLEFSFTLEDSGPDVAWTGSKPVVECVARSVGGQLLIKGIVYEDGVKVPELLHPKFKVPEATLKAEQDARDAKAAEAKIDEGTQTKAAAKR